MPLSEGATRARHARRLLQRVLDYAPDGTTIHPIVRIGRHAAEGIVEAVGRAGGRPHHLRLGRPDGDDPRGRCTNGGRASAAASPRRPSSRRRSTRSSATSPCDIAVVKQRGSKEIKRILVPVRGGPHAELALRFADAIAQLPRRDGRRPPPRPARGSRSRSAPRPNGRSPRSSSSTCAAAARPLLREAPNVRNAILREAEKADLVVMGASAQTTGARRRDAPVRGAAGGDRRAREADGHRRQDARADRAADVRAAGRARRDARRRRPRRRGGAGRPGPRRALVRRVELPPRRVRRPAPPRHAQGEAGADGQPRPADARRGGDDRADRAQGDARDGRARAAARRDPRHRLRVDRPDPRDRRGGGRPRRPAPRRPRPLRLVPRQGRGALEVALRDHRRHRRLGRHGRPELAPADGLRDARPAPPRAAAPVRQGLLPAPDRRGRHPQGGRRRPRHRARRAAADQPVLPGAVRDDPAARRRVRRAALAARADPVLHRATRSRSATSSMPRSGSASRASARSTSSGGSTATRSSRACRGCRSSSSRR